MLVLTPVPIYFVKCGINLKIEKNTQIVTKFGESRHTFLLISKFKMFSPGTQKLLIIIIN